MIKLFLMGSKGLFSLQNLNPEFYSLIDRVVIGKDQKVQNDYSKELFSLSKELKIKAFLRSGDHDNKNIKLLIAIGWRWLIKSNLKLIVFHDSILPKYRGFNPLVTALINGDNEIGVTAIEATEEFDKGDIIKQKKVSISHPITIRDAINKISFLYADMLNAVIHDYLDNNLSSLPQNEELVSFSLWRDEHDYKIDWNKSAAEIVRFIYALGYPYMGAKTKIGKKNLRIFYAEEVDDVVIANRTPGKVLFKNNTEYTIVCGKGLLKVSEFFNDDGDRVTFKNKFRLRFGK